MDYPSTHEANGALKSRRKFFTQGVAALIGARLMLTGATLGAIFMTGCNLFTDIETWVPVGIAAFNSILTLLEGAGVINPAADTGIRVLIQNVNAAFAQIIADVKAYQAIQPPPAGALQKIQDVLGIVVSNFQQFLNSINVSDSKLLALVVGLAQIILSTLAAFQTKLAAQGTVIPARGKITGRMIISKQSVAIVPKERSASQFKKDFNKAAKDGGHPEIQIH